MMLIDWWMKFSVIIGVMSLRKSLLKVLRGVYYFFKRAPSLQKYGEGSWAVVTGASDGIGQGYCEELAKEGFNICMISRTTSKLENVDQILRKINPKIETLIISCDFASGTSPQFYEAIFEKVRNLNIGILVNNVGILNLSNLDKLDEKAMRDELLVNLLPITLLSHHIIPLMLKRTSKSAIINLSSTAI